MLFLTPNQQCQGTEGTLYTKNSTWNLIIKLQIHREAEEKEPLLFYEYFIMQCNLTKFRPLIIMNIIIELPI